MTPDRVPEASRGLGRSHDVGEQKREQRTRRQQAIDSVAYSVTDRHEGSRDSQRCNDRRWFGWKGREGGKTLRSRGEKSERNGEHTRDHAVRKGPIDDQVDAKKIPTEHRHGQSRAQ